MPWHDPKTWMLRELVTPDDLNQQIRDNLRYLNAEMPVGCGYVATGGSTTSTAFVEMNQSTKVTLDIKGTRILAILSFRLTVGAENAAGSNIELFLDNAVSSGVLYGINGVTTGSTLHFMTVHKLFTGLTPGSHAIIPRMAAITAGNNNWGYTYVHLTAWGL
jgi:hypothetical protein